MILTFVYLQRGDLHTMSLNNWGDFLAGAVAPLILLWVIIGFYQNQDDLRLQIKEVAQMARASNRQAQATEESVALSIEEKELAARPKLMYWPGGSSSSRDGQRINIKNRGGEVYGVDLQHEGDHYMSVTASTVWEADAEYALLVKEKTIGKSQVEPFKFPIRFSIYATDTLGYRHKMDFEFSENFSGLEYPSHSWKKPTSGN